MSEIRTLGPVGLNPLGDYNSQTEYEKLDVVLYQDSSYIALKPVQGIVPTNAEYWQKLVSGGYESGSTLERPTSNIMVGKLYFDTTLGKPIWYNGNNWVDATGTQV